MTSGVPLSDEEIRRYLEEVAGALKPKGRHHTMLVVGGSAGAAVSLNEQRARKLRSAGLPIAIVSEVDFIAMTGSGQSPSD